MPNTLKTAFWRKAAQSLPAPYRARYAGHFEDAAKFELALDALLQLASRARTFFHAPRARSAH
jgi:hypothetical protein